MTIPYVVGQWVRGDRFYGRAAVLDDLLSSTHRLTWLIGGRRIGKTSVLRQAELLATHSCSHIVPLYWDLQGATDGSELAWTLHDAILDSKALDSAGWRHPPGPDSERDVDVALEALGRELEAQGKTLLLLCDEAEELLDLMRQAPEALTQLAALVARTTTIRVVLTGSVRLSTLARARTKDGSPLFAGATHSLLLGPLDARETRSLILQENRPAKRRPGLGPTDVHAIREACGDHPYLVQLLCKRFQELGNLDHAVVQVESDPMIDHFFGVDMALLGECDRGVLRRVANEGRPLPTQGLRAGSQDEVEQVEESCTRLIGLGYAAEAANGDLMIRNQFLRRWLTSQGPETVF